MRNILFATAALCGAIAFHASASTPGKYALDTSFNNGRYFVDAFASTPAQDYVGKKLVRLSNGDVVTAGIVPDLRGGNSGGLGLVRYNAAGQRVAWSNPGVDGYDGNQYVVYNPNYFVPQTFDDVKAISVFDNRLFVLVDTSEYSITNTFPPHTYFAGYGAEVIVFGLDGAYLGGVEMGSTDADYGDARNFSGGGFAVYANSFTSTSENSLVFAGTRTDTGIAKPVFRRFTVNDDSTFTDETGLIDLAVGTRCARGCEINGVALGGRLLTGSPPRIYLGGSLLVSDKNWDYLAIEVSGSGKLSTSFGTGGIATVAFNLAGYTLEDRGRAIAVVGGGLTTNDDRVFVAGDVAVKCGDGVGIVKFLPTGAPDTSFGPGGLGKMYDGGNYSSSFCVLPRTDYRLHALAIDGNSIAMVGQRNSGSIFIGGGSATYIDALFEEFDGNGTVINSFDVFPFADTGTSRSRDSALWGVVSAGDGAFTTAGFVTYTEDASASLRGHSQYATARFHRPVDSIFKNGFQSP